MKNFAIVAALFLLFGGIQYSNAQSKPFKATAKQMAALQKQADELTAAMTAQNFKQVLTYTYPAIVEAMGGKDKALEKFKASMVQMQSQGAAISSVTTGDIKEIVKSGKDLYSVVPDILQMKFNGTVITHGSYLLAISHNNGVNWYFVDTAPFKKQNLRKLFPTYPPGLVIPEISRSGMGQGN